MITKRLRLHGMAICVAAAIGLSACGGGGGGGGVMVRTPTDERMPPPVHAVALAGVHGLADWLTGNPGGIVTVPAGEYRNAGGVRFSCAAGGDDCRVSVMLDDGAVTATSTGGMASADVINPVYWILQSADSLLMSDSLAYTDLLYFRIQTECTGTACTVSALGRTGNFSLSDARAALGNLTSDEPPTATETHRGVSLNTVEDYDGWLDYNLFVAGRGVTQRGTYPVGMSIGVATGSNPVHGSATWSGVMAGVDVSETSSYRNRIRGDADLTIADFADPKLDVAFTNISDVDAGRRRADMTWDDIPLTRGGFGTGSDGDSIQGKFYGPNHEEVGGIFEREQVVGAFGGKRP